MIPDKSKEEYDIILQAKLFYEKKQIEHVGKHGCEFDTNMSIAIVMQEFLEFYNHQITQADIRNKLSPVSNLISMLSDDNKKKSKMTKFIKNEMDQVTKSVKYLSDFL